MLEMMVIPRCWQIGNTVCIRASSRGSNCATKYAVRAISDGLRQENDKLRVTCVYPGVVTSELADSITDESAAEAMATYRSIALKPEAIANAHRSRD